MFSIYGRMVRLYFLQRQCKISKNLLRLFYPHGQADGVLPDAENRPPLGRLKKEMHG